MVVVVVEVVVVVVVIEVSDLILILAFVTGNLPKPHCCFATANMFICFSGGLLPRHSCRRCVRRVERG